jgi:glycosyltransferase involved in cell wall biosynthesis
MTNTREEGILFSIVVPTYNRANIVGKTIESLQRQQYSNYEILIVDDGSTDNLEAAVRPYLNSQTFYLKKNNAERAAARNYGAVHAKGQYVNFFDSDDLAFTNHLSEAAEMIRSLKNPEWFHLGYSFASPEGILLKTAALHTEDTLNAKMCKGNLLSCNGVFVRKDILLQNKFNEDRALSASEDYELWCRLSARYPLYYSNVVTSQVIEHDMRSVLQMNSEKLLVRLELLVKYLREDKEVRKYFGNSFRKIEAEAYSYGALHLAQPAFKWKSIQYLLKTLYAYPLFIQKRRFYAILRNILIKW